MKLPYLDFWLDINILQIKTELLYYERASQVKSYICMKVTLFHKWGFHFRLYSPDRG